MVQDIWGEIAQVESEPPRVWPDGQFYRLKWLGSHSEPDYFKSTLSQVKEFISDEGAKIADELHDRWVKARYGPRP